MKYYDPQDLDRLPGRHLCETDTFRFRCHAGAACFNRCCRNLNLFLYPYDVLRLRKRLGVTSDRFLDTYVDVVLREGDFFPEVVLRMVENRDRTCPFVSAEGCTVYPDRPDTCRTFPVEQGLLYDARGKACETHWFFRPPDFCRGPFEETQWTPLAWTRDQEGESYNRMTARWAEIRSLFQADPWGAEGPQGPRAKMAFMATYNIDRFGEFVFESSFLKRYKIKAACLGKIRKGNEVELLMLGFEWVLFFVWGRKPTRFSPR
jgi:Fe-S-cluster containining protein